jgi:hypothetical protein
MKATGWAPFIEIIKRAEANFLSRYESWRVAQEFKFLFKTGDTSVWIPVEVKN